MSSHSASLCALPLFSPLSTSTLHTWQVVAILGFGSNFVPVKRFETGDGMFYQWVMCIGVFLYGTLLQLVLFAHPLGPTLTEMESAITPADVHKATRPDAFSVKLYPAVFLGGALWATGNVMAVPVINAIGLGMGLLLWGCTNMLTGWASGRFINHALFPDVPADTLQTEWLNDLGVVLVLVALTLYTRIEPEPLEPTPEGMRPAGATHEDEQGSIAASNNILLQMPSADESAVPKATATSSGTATRLVGIGLAMLSGIFYGSNFTPNTVLIAMHLGSENPLDYVFSHFTGIFLASSFYFVAYCAYMRSAPRVYPRLILPGLLSGVVWAIAQTCWFLANNAVSMSVAFPIVTSGPGAVGALWGIFVFGEIRGRRNYLWLSTAIVLSAVGCALISVSKGDST